MRGPRVAVYAIQWILTSGTTRDVVVATGNGQLLLDMKRICEVLDQLFGSEASTEYPSRVLQHRCEETIRKRLACALRGPTSHHARALGRKIVKLARTESAARRFDNLAVLDGALRAVLVGTNVGVESKLRDLLQTSCDFRKLADWTTSSQRTPRDVIDVRVEAVLFGDGSQP